MRAYSRLSLAAPGAVPNLGARGEQGVNMGDSVVAGRWLWTSGRLVADPGGGGGGSLEWCEGAEARGASGWVRWDVQAACAAPALLLWAQPPPPQRAMRAREGLGDGAVTVTAVLPGLYRCARLPRHLIYPKLLLMQHTTTRSP